MLWGQSKEIRDTLDAILLHINRIDESLRGMRDHARQVHCESADREREMRQKLDTMSNALITFSMGNKQKGKGGRKKKDAPTS